MTSFHVGIDKQIGIPLNFENGRTYSNNRQIFNIINAYEDPRFEQTLLKNWFQNSIDFKFSHI
jgi:hypothetical protein